MKFRNKTKLGDIYQIKSHIASIDLLLLIQIELVKTLPVTRMRRFLYKNKNLFNLRRIRIKRYRFTCKIRSINIIEKSDSKADDSNIINTAIILGISLGTVSFPSLFY